VHTEFTECLLYSVQNTIYKTAHLKVFTDHWMYPVSLFASIFPYSKQKSTYTCCLCEVHSVMKEDKLPIQATVSCSALTFTATVLSPQQFSCQCAPSLTRFLHGLLISFAKSANILTMHKIRYLEWFACFRFRVKGCVTAVTKTERKTVYFGNLYDPFSA